MNKKTGWYFRTIGSIAAGASIVGAFGVAGTGDYAEAEKKENNAKYKTEYELKEANQKVDAQADKDMRKGALCVGGLLVSGVVLYGLGSKGRR